MLDNAMGLILKQIGYMDNDVGNKEATYNYIMGCLDMAERLGAVNKILADFVRQVAAEKRNK